MEPMPDTPTPPTRSPSAPTRRKIGRGVSPLAAALALGGVILAMTLLFTLNAGLFKEDAARRSATADKGRMAAIDQPYSGSEPERPGDRGGWEQLALLGVITVALAGGTAGMVFSGRRARRRAASIEPD